MGREQAGGLSGRLVVGLASRAIRERPRVPPAHTSRARRTPSRKAALDTP